MRQLTILLVLGACLACAQGYDDAKTAAAKAIRQGKPVEAQRIAEPLSKAAPDDIDLWYSLAQAYRLQGKLDLAEKATQWMLDLRPDFLGGLWEAGLLREHAKDLAGAVDLLNNVYRQIPAYKSEDRARILTDIARIFDKQELKADAAMLRKEIDRLKEPDRANTPPHP